MSRTNVDKVLLRLSRGKGLRPDEYQALLENFQATRRHIARLEEARSMVDCIQSPKCSNVCAFAETAQPAATQGFNTVMKIADLDKPKRKRKPAAKKRAARR